MKTRMLVDPDVRRGLDGLPESSRRACLKRRLLAVASLRVKLMFLSCTKIERDANVGKLQDLIPVLDQASIGPLVLGTVLRLQSWCRFPGVHIRARSLM